MSDVFISYARSTARQAQAVAEALRGLGYSIWMDEDLPAHRTYTHVIEAELTAAKAALVIWSAEAVRSEWVLSEANRAREDHKLVQLTVDNARLPMPFDQIQCADLNGWNGDARASGWRKVAASVAELIGPDTRSSHSAPSPGQRTKPAERLLAVLAFDNLSADPDMVYFSDGVSEEIQQTVARAADLKVIGRTSSFQFRGADKVVRRVAAELGATHVLDGSVRRSGAKVRISAQLIECASETTLWSERFDRDLADIFAVQDEIAEAVAAALKIAFAPPAAAQAVDPAAYELYLRARELYAKDMISDAPVELLERAVALAPKFARAWAALANGRARAMRFRQGDQSDGALRAGIVDAAAKAFGLDPDSPDAYLALSYLPAAGRYLEREAPISKALAVAPNDPEVLSFAGNFCGQVGRMRQALDYLRQAHELDRLYSYAANIYGLALDALGRHAEANEIWDASRKRWPDVEITGAFAIFGAALSGDWARFDALVQSVRENGLGTSLNTRINIHLGRYLRRPDPEILARDLALIRAELAQPGNTRTDGLVFLCRAGMIEETFDLIDQISFPAMFDEGVGSTPQGYQFGVLFSTSYNAAMMRDPRFVRLCAKLGLVDYWVQSDRWPDCAETVPYDFKAEARRLAAPPAG